MVAHQWGSLWRSGANELRGEGPRRRTAINSCASSGTPSPDINVRNAASASAALRRCLRRCADVPPGGRGATCAVRGARWRRSGSARRRGFTSRSDERTRFARDARAPLLAARAWRRAVRSRWRQVRGRPVRRCCRGRGRSDSRRLRRRGRHDAARDSGFEGPVRRQHDPSPAAGRIEARRILRARPGSAGRDRCRARQRMDGGHTVRQRRS